MTRRVDKVIVYVTRGERLLVFTHPDFPAAGLQVPAGTVEPGEATADAARREAREETGLERLSGWAFLGERERAMADTGRDETQRRFFFHARCDDLAAPERWRRVERYRSEGSASAAGEVVFELFWAPLRRVAPDLIAGPELIAGQGALLRKLSPALR